MDIGTQTFPAAAKCVSLRDSFLASRMEIVADKLIPYQWRALNDWIPDAEPSFCVRNFRAAAGIIQSPHGGFAFQDSDLYKWIEAAAYSLTYRPDADLEATIDSAVELIGGAQWPDGYINTYYTLTDPDKRWTDLMNKHELYCAGHLIEAAVAYFRVSGKDALLNIARRFVDHIDSRFGAEAGKLCGYPGHEVIEMALCALYEVTGEQKHLRLAKDFIDRRGQAPLFFEEEYRRGGNEFWWKNSFGMKYYQAHRPVREQTVAVGHAVRACYLYSGMADVARLTGDAALLDACRALWHDITRRQMYITGAVGQSREGEAFSFGYDLPNALVYGETCASVAMAFFARRMLRIEPRGEYADVMETMLYNGATSGMSLDGTGFFYVNPLESWPARNEGNLQFSHVKSERQKWFACACCPPNLGRLIAGLPGYVWHTRGDTAYLNLITEGEARLALDGGMASFCVHTRYPWDGRVEIAVREAPNGAFLALRIPGWCADYSLMVNDAPAGARADNGYIRVAVAPGDTVRMALSMPVNVLRANPRVMENAGKVAVARGPVVYCLEEADNGEQLWNLYLIKDEHFREQWEDRLGGIVALYARGVEQSLADMDEETLYAQTEPVYDEVTLTFIPYYAWANRSKGEMCVWVKEIVK